MCLDYNVTLDLDSLGLESMQLYVPATLHYSETYNNKLESQFGLVLKMIYKSLF